MHQLNLCHCLIIYCVYVMRTLKHVSGNAWLHTVAHYCAHSTLTTKEASCDTPVTGLRNELIKK